MKMKGMQGTKRLQSVVVLVAGQGIEAAPENAAEKWCGRLGTKM